jgi:hypothetical protein
MAHRIALTRRTLTKTALAGGIAAALPAGAASAGTHRRMVRARRKVFGSDNVDPRTGEVRPDRVVASWFGVAGFAIAMRGRVFLVDAWVPRGTHSGYVPTSPRELAALAPRAIFIGHGHFDHAADAGEIAAASGAVVVGTAEHCSQVAGQTDRRIRTLPAFRVGAPPGQRADVDALRGVEVTAVKHVHSAARPPDLSDPHTPVLPAPNPCTMLEHPPTPDDMVDTGGHLGDEEGGTVLYQFRVGSFRLTWHDSSGPLEEDAPHVLDVLRGLPRSDVQVGAIQTFNQVTNGLRDPRLYIEALRPRLFVPCHHDDWAAAITTTGDRWEPAMRAELRRIPEHRRPRLRFLRDPQDYLRPDRLTFALR